MELITSIDQAKQAIHNFSGRPEDFMLPVSNVLLDEIGINMAIITDSILARGWEPNGFEQGEGFRVYRYKTLGE